MGHRFVLRHVRGRAGAGAVTAVCSLELRYRCFFIRRPRGVLCAQKHVGPQARTKGTHFNKGGCRLIVQWYERAPGDEVPLVVRVGADFVNSTELWHVLTAAGVISQRARRGGIDS